MELVAFSLTNFNVYFLKGNSTKASHRCCKFIFFNHELHVAPINTDRADRSILPAEQLSAPGGRGKPSPLREDSDYC